MPSWGLLLSLCLPYFVYSFDPSHTIHHQVLEPHPTPSTISYSSLKETLSRAQDTIGRGTPSTGCVTLDSQTHAFRFQDDASSQVCVSSGWYKDTLSSQGWDELYLETSASFADLDQAYAAGYLEGVLTRGKMWDFYLTRVKNDFGPDGTRPSKDSVHDFVMKQDAYLRRLAQPQSGSSSLLEKVGATKSETTSLSAAQRVTQQIEKSNDNDNDHEHVSEGSYWFNVHLILNQLDGLLKGYNDHSDADKQLRLFDVWMFNLDGDLTDIERAVSPGQPIALVQDMGRQELISFISLRGRCSAIIKWTGDDLFVGHTTWSDYAELYRMYKHHNFNFKHPSIKSKKNSFSSYPGFLFSSDDWNLLDTGLVVLETTLNILNEKLYSACDPEATVMAFIRAMLANRLATSGEEWVNTFVRHNSGTYNNQWMIVDYKRFKSGDTQLTQGLLWLLEQIPGHVEFRDMSAQLEKDTYWASYNRPFFDDVNRESAYDHYASLLGDIFTYKDCKRAKIFAREQSKIHDVESMKVLMRLNKYQTDPLSAGCPGEAIAARYDLPPTQQCDTTRQPAGGTDSKVTNSGWVPSLKCVTVGGPTADDQPPFNWDDWPQIRPVDQPTTWNFPWRTMQPSNVAPNSLFLQLQTQFLQQQQQLRQNQLQLQHNQQIRESPQLANLREQHHHQQEEQREQAQAHVQETLNFLRN